MCSGAVHLYGIPRVTMGENLSFKREEALLKSQGVSIEVRQDTRCIMIMMDVTKTEPELRFEDIGREWL
jgi:cytosine/creatinine deaminase